jgi:hypothetical protein
VKPLYGRQEGAVVSYNPQKPGRPSHSYHCYTVGNLRLVPAVDVAFVNWRNLFVRLADPNHHREAITSRPLLLQAIGRQTQQRLFSTITTESRQVRAT